MSNKTQKELFAEPGLLLRDIHKLNKIFGCNLASTRVPNYFMAIISNNAVQLKLNSSNKEEVFKLKRGK